MLLFADDSKLFNHVSVQTAAEDCAATQRNLVRLEDWSRTWLLRFHPGKCHVLSLGEFMNTPCRAYNYQLCGQSLEHVFEERDLGVIIDSSLTFELHIDNKVNVANAFLGMVRRNFSFLDQQTLIRLYTAFVRPHIEYCHAVWSPSRVPLIRKLEAVQIRGVYSVLLVGALVRKKKIWHYVKEEKNVGYKKLKMENLSIIRNWEMVWY